MKKVVHIVANLNRGGAELRILEGIRALKKDYKFAIICCYKGSDESMLTECRELGVEVYEPDFEFSLMRHMSYLRNVLIHLKGKSYSIVHSHTMHHSGLVMMLAYRDYSKRIAHARNSGSNKNGVLANIYFMIGKLLITVFANERVANSSLSGHFLFGKLPFRVLLNCGDYSSFLKISKKTINHKEINLLCVARLDPIKNIEGLLDYMPELPNVNLTIVGSGQLRQLLLDKTLALSIEDKVNFVGQVENVTPYYANADIFVLPSKREGLAGVVIEAQASGLHCIVSTSIPDEADFKIGLLHRFDFEKGSSKELSSVIQRVAHLKSPNTFSRELVINKSFSMEKERLEYLDLYG